MAVMAAWNSCDDARGLASNTGLHRPRRQQGRIDSRAARLEFASKRFRQRDNGELGRGIGCHEREGRNPPTDAVLMMRDEISVAGIFGTKA